MGGCFFSCVVGCSRAADYTRYKICKLVSDCAACTDVRSVEVEGCRKYAIYSATCDRSNIIARLRVFMWLYWTKSTPMNGFDFKAYMKIFGNNLRIKIRDLDDRGEKKDTTRVKDVTREL